jgi:hypothetical protein
VPRECWLPIAAAILGATVVVATFHPGLVMSDATDQLNQARTHQYYDWHPVAMALVWSLLDRIAPGPILMLVLQNLLFWGGLAAAASVLIGGWRGALLLLVLGFWPPIFAFLGDVGTDSQMAAALMGAFGLISVWDVERRRTAAVGALACLLYASAVRHNGFVTSLPMALLLVPRGRWWVALPVVLGLVAVEPAATALIGAPKSFPVQQIFLHDLAAVSVAEGRDLIPPRFEGPGPLPFSRLIELYRPDDIDPLVWPSTPGPHLLFSWHWNEVATLPALWLETIARHPGPYLRHRGRLFLSLLGVGGDVHGPFLSGMEPNHLGIVLKPCAWRERILRAFGAIQESFVFRGWVYLLASVIALMGAIGFVSLHHRLLIALSASSLANVLPYSLVGPTCDFRFVIWTVMAGTLALGLTGLLALRERGWR